MQDSSAPTKIVVPWGAGAAAPYINAVPVASQIPITPGRASWTDGFPPLNSILRASGGVPPFIGDMNGGLNQTSAGVQWLQAGGPIVYDVAYQTAIGGYPKGALVASAATAGVWWLSTADNNATNPDAGGAGWQPVVVGTFATTLFGNSGAGTFTYTAVTPSFDLYGWGGGGAGSGNLSAQAGTGGAGGGFGFKRVSGVTVGATISVTIAAAAAGGSAGGANGANGGTSSFGSIMSVPGGGGGPHNSNAGAAGGAAPTGCDLAIAGQSAYGVGDSAATIVGGGGGAPWGGAGGANTNVGGGANGTWPGGGGGSGSNGTAGGNGALGGFMVIPR